MPEQHVEVLIVGAGLSGIGAACHLRRSCPGKTFALLEARERSGGTWDLFRYPGVRSDSDMYTLGYSFRPWLGRRAIADGSSILQYVRDAAREHDVERHIRFNHRVTSADFSNAEALWTVRAQRTDTGETVELTCSFLLMCSGYYHYDEGYTPELPGRERFEGQIVHPQHWGEDVDYEGKRVVVIGSGATAITLVPALAGKAQHVTMLQRSPSYVLSLPGEDPIAKVLRRVLYARRFYSVLRWKNVLAATVFFQLSRHRPDLIKDVIRRRLEDRLPPGYDIDTHFTPSYNPWDQRVCLVPDDDLFDAIGEGHASVVTDRIDTFTEQGLSLASGAQLDADLVVTATGLRLLVLGGIELSVDGEDVEVPTKMAYRGMMLSDVPNLAFVFGYANASWTLKADLTSEYVCRLLSHMDEHGYARCVAHSLDDSIETEPFIDFSSGYIRRSIAEFPKQGSRAPWRLYQNYPLDILSLRRGSLEDGTLQFHAAAERPAQTLAA